MGARGEREGKRGKCAGKADNSFSCGGQLISAAISGCNVQALLDDG